MGTSSYHKRHPQIRTITSNFPQLSPTQRGTHIQFHDEQTKKYAVYETCREKHSIGVDNFKFTQSNILKEGSKTFRCSNKKCGASLLVDSALKCVLQSNEKFFATLCRINNKIFSPRPKVSLIISYSPTTSTIFLLKRLFSLVFAQNAHNL